MKSAFGNILTNVNISRALSTKVPIENVQPKYAIILCKLAIYKLLPLQTLIGLFYKFFNHIGTTLVFPTKVNSTVAC